MSQVDDYVVTLLSKVRNWIFAKMFTPDLTERMMLEIRTQRRSIQCQECFRFMDRTFEGRIHTILPICCILTKYVRDFKYYILGVHGEVIYSQCNRENNDSQVK